MNSHPSTPDLEELIEHASWVRALAQQLVGESGAADDLVQDTWLAALRHPPREGSPRAWLRRVVYNLAGTAHRQSRAQRWHEDERSRHQAEQSASALGADDLIPELELQQKLAALVQSMAEPYRTTLLQRYYQGLSSAEIARRAGVPAATVRSRLKRGIEALQRELDEQHQGERQAWLQALMPLCSPAAGDVAAPTLSNTLLGLLSMSSAIKLGLVVAAAALLIFSLRMQSGLAAGGEAPASQQATVGADESDGAQPLAAGGAAAAAEATRQALLKRAETNARETPPAQLAVRLRLLDDQERALDGVQVEASWNKQSLSSRSGSDGVLEFTFERSGKDARLTFLCEREGLVCKRFSRESDDSASLDLGDIGLQRAGLIAGRILDAQGEPVAEARVLVVSSFDSTSNLRRTQMPLVTGCGLETTSAADGEYRLENVPPGWRRVLAKTEGTYVGWSLPLEVEAAEHYGPVDVSLAAEREVPTVGGLVLLPDGSAADDVRLAFLPSNRGSANYGYLSRAKQGRFLFEHVHQHNGPLRIIAWSNDGRASMDEFHTVELGEEAEIRLSPAPTIEVQVSTSDGSALPRFTASLFDEELKLDYDRQKLRGKAAEAPVSLMRPLQRSFHVTVSAEGYATAELGPFQGGSSPAVLPVSLRRLARLSGSLHAGDEAVAKARVGAYRIDGEWNDKAIAGLPLLRAGAAAATTRTDKQGEFELTLGAVGRYVLRLEHKDHAPVESEPFDFDGQSDPAAFELKTGLGCAIEGEVSVPSGESRAGRLVAATRGDHGPQTTRTDSEGRFRFEGLMPGPWWVTLHDREVPKRKTTISSSLGATEPAYREPGWRLPVSCEIAPGRDGWVSLEAQVAVTCELEGTLAIDGEAVESWQVRAFEVFGDGTPNWQSGERAEMSGGSFSLSPLKPATYQLRMQGTGDDGHSYVLYDRIELASGSNHYERQWKTGRLEGYLSAALLAEPAIYMLVWSGPDESYAMDTFKVDGAGHFDAGLVPAGTWKMTAPTQAQVLQNPKDWKVLGEVEVPPAEKALLDLR